MILLLNMDLLPGQQMIINTRYLMMMEYSCTIEIQNVKRIKNRFFGNENLFNTVISAFASASISIVQSRRNST